MISEHPDIWFKDDDNLTYRVCEDGKSRTIIDQVNADFIIPMIYMKYPPTQFHLITSVIEMMNPEGLGFFWGGRGGWRIGLIIYIHQPVSFRGTRVF